MAGIHEAATLVVPDDPSQQETQTLVVKNGPGADDEQPQADGASKEHPQAGGASSEHPQAEGAPREHPQAEGAPGEHPQAEGGAPIPGQSSRTTAEGGDDQGVQDVQKAIVNFASHHKLDAKAVTKQQVIQSAEGIIYWATKHDDVSARGSHAQAMKRAFKWRQDMGAAYQVLTDAMKVDFRRAWTATKSFDFMTTRRTTTTSFRKRRDEAGKFVTKLQLINILGGCSQPEAVRQAERYMAMCQRPQLKTYFWVETLICSTNEQQWTNTVTIEATEAVPNSLAEKVIVCKAMRAYAHSMKRPLGSVTEQEVAETKLGIKGYAELYATVAEHIGTPKMDGSNNPPFPSTGNSAVTEGKTKKNKRAKQQEDDQQPAGDDDKENSNPDPTPKKPRKDQTGPRKEKEVKELLAMEQSSDVSMGRIMSEFGKNPADWSWAKELIADYKTYRTEVLRLYADVAGFQSLKVAALSPKESAKVKKEWGEGYVGKLVEFVTVAGPQIQKMAEAAFGIEKMAAAKNQAADFLIAKPKAKAKGKSKASLKRSASSKSLPSV
ncbi:unnamed protein product [Symbiodinium microadriaticum]|nr:unnamed protein product [Symbiodinium microadriaticum]CAE7836448.1 unnamed protein product [Symbiodinium sp. KB8]